MIYTENLKGWVTMNKITIPDDHQDSIRRLLKELPEGFINKGNGVLHVGAHMGEEVPEYLEYGFTDIHLVEANPQIASALTDKFSTSNKINIINAAVCDKNGFVDLIIHQTLKGSVESASLLNLKKLGEIAPVFNSEIKCTVPATTLDKLATGNLLSPNISLLVLDIQGAELMALSSGLNFLKTLSAVILEVNLIENYEDCPLEKEIDEFMIAQGFKKQFSVYHEFYNADERYPGWGECLWIKNGH